MHRPVSTTLSGVGRRALRYLVPLLLAFALTVAVGLALTQRVLAQDEDTEPLTVVAVGTTTFTGYTYESGSRTRTYHCIKFSPAVSVSVDDATPGLVGFCDRLTYRTSTYPRTYTHEGSYIFWDAALPNSTSTMRLSLPYLHVFSGGVSLEDEDSFPPETNSVVMGGWNTRSLTSTFPDYSNKTLGGLVPAAAAIYYNNRSITARNGDVYGAEGDTYTLILTDTPFSSSVPTTPTELRVTPNDDHSDRTLGWEWDDGILLLDTEVHRQELSSSETGSNLWGSDIYFTEADGVNTHGHSFVDDTVNSATTYRYRLRVKTHWESSEWSEYYLSSELPRDEPSAVPAVIYPRPDQERFTLADDGSPRGYQFEIIGEDAAWPVQVAIQGDAFRLSATLQTVTDCTGLDDTLSIERDAREFYLYVCEAGDATLLLRSGVDGQLYADYPLFTAATTVAPRPDQSPGELFVDRSGEDHLGITGALEQLFEHTAMNADPVLAKNFLVLVLTVGIGAVPLLRRGRMDVPALTNGFILASLVMWGATIVAGYPIWWAVTPSALLVSVGIIGFASRLRAGR